MVIFCIYLTIFGNLTLNKICAILYLKGGKDMLNQVVLVGRLTQDPVVEETVNNKKYTAITVAVQRSFKNASGVYETDFIRCVLWNGVASSTKEYCHTGDIVGIKGRLQNRSYETEQKETKYITEVIAERVTFIQKSKKNNADDTLEVTYDDIP